MLILEQHGFKFEVEIMLRGGRMATGPLNGEKPVEIIFRLAEGEFERIRAAYPERSEAQCRDLLEAIYKDLIERCGREGIRIPESSDGANSNAAPRSDTELVSA